MRHLLRTVTALDPAVMCLRVALFLDCKQLARKPAGARAAIQIQPMRTCRALTRANQEAQCRVRLEREHAPLR